MAKNEQWDATRIPEQKNRIIIITGASSGIGKEAARVLAGKHANVIIAVRNMDKGEAAVRDIKQQFSTAALSVRELDLAELSSVTAFAKGINNDYSQLDVLINNAGIMACPFARTKDGFEMQIGTNHLGHFALTLQLLPLLQKTAQARVVTISSIAHKMGRLDLTDLNWHTRKYKTSKAYADSKIANLYFTTELQRRLTAAGSKLKAVAAHPGWTRTDLQRHSGLFSFLNPFFSQGVEMGALPTLRAGFDDNVQPGDYYGPTKFAEMHGYPVKTKAKPLAYDEKIASELWELSEKLTGCQYGNP